MGQLMTCLHMNLPNSSACEREIQRCLTCMLLASAARQQCMHDARQKLLVVASFRVNASRNGWSDDRYPILHLKLVGTFQAKGRGGITCSIRDP